METVTSADGTSIVFERTGDGPPLVLVHGASVDHTTWGDAVPLLGEHFTVYAMDRRGRGESDDGAEYALDREAEDVIALVDAIGEPVHLLGHSFGGLCSLEAALRTDRLRSLILYEPGIVGDPTPEEEAALAEMRTAIDDGDRERALIAFYRGVAHLTEDELERVRSEETWPRRVDAVHTISREMTVEHAYDFAPDRVRELTTPTLLLVGEESPPDAHREAETLADALPDSHIAVLENQHHVAYRMAPERFAATVIEFLTGQSGP